MAITMKTKLKAALLTVLALSMLIVCGTITKKEPRVDLPEEYPLISNDSLDQTLMVAYQKDGVIHLGFKH